MTFATPKQMSAKQLRAALEDLGCPSTGLKPVLVKRLLKAQQDAEESSSEEEIVVPKFNNNQSPKKQTEQGASLRQRKGKDAATSPMKPQKKKKAPFYAGWSLPPKPRTNLGCADMKVLARLLVIVLGFLSIAPMLHWNATVGLPNWSRTAQERFMDTSPPYPRTVYNGAYPAILNVPVGERIFWFTCRLPMFLWKAVKTAPVAMWKGLWNHKTQPLSDEEWITYWSDAWPSSFLKEVTAVSDVPYMTLKMEKDTKYWQACFPVMGGWAYDEGMYGADSSVLFSRKTGVKDLTPVAIWLGAPFDEGAGVVFKPENKGWAGAKTFALHGATHYYVLSYHPMSHFPMDTVNGLTKNNQFMPAYHPIRQLLWPHFRLTLPLNDAVMNDWFLSILLNPYFLHCFDTSAETKIFNTAVAAWAEYDFNNEYVVLHPTDRPSILSEFVVGYRKIFTKFVTAVVKEQGDGAFNNQHSANWASEIAKHIPGFPQGADMIADEALLIHTLVNIMVDLSVEHAAEHYLYATQIPLTQGPWRLHAAPPSHPEEEWDFEKGTQTYWDFVNFYCVNEVFFFFGPWDTIKNTDYAFGTPGLEAIQDTFIKDMEAYEQEMIVAGTNIVPLQMIGPSIDY